LITRQAHPTDGRTTLAEITPSGRRMAEKATTLLNATVFQEPGLDPAGVADLVSVLGELRRRAGDFAGG
jgi:DNA-binding MarR family transcriptional regulator